MPSSPFSPITYHKPETAVCMAPDGHQQGGAKGESGAGKWDLSGLYQGLDDPAIKADLAWATDAAARFAADFEGRCHALSASALAGAIRRFEALQERMDKIMSYAQLIYAQDHANPRHGQFMQTMQEETSTISLQILFFSLAMLDFDDAALDALIAEDEDLAHYAPWLRDQRVMRPHRLSDELERFIHDKQVSGRAAWIRLFDESQTAMRFDLDGQKLTMTEVQHQLHAPDAALRARAFSSIATGLSEHISLYSLITNSLAKEKEIDDRWRKLPRPVSGRNLANLVEDAVVDALVGSVKQAYGRLSHRYYQLKAQWMGQKKLALSDRLAPVPGEDAAPIPFEEARQIVLDAYRRFSPTLADLGAQFFDRQWIDIYPAPGKSGGAFAHPTVPSSHPFLLLNYQGQLRDVMTLAHELGHGVHQCLAAKQGHLISQTPLTLAETASVFGEMLTFRALLDGADTPATRRALLANKIEDMLNTVVRQTAFYDFESQLHAARRRGELSPDEIGALWMAASRESLGDAFEYVPEYQHFWAYIPHFIHSPFYVYAYAFGDCLVNALYGAYQDDPTDFEPRYLAMLEAGGRLRHQQLLAPFGFDATNPDFWQRGLSVIEGMIDELAAMLPTPTA